MSRTAWIVLCLLLVVPGARAAQDAPPAGNAKSQGSQITLNLKDADIRQVAQMVSSITGKNFIVDPRAQGRVTVISSKPISANALFSVFLSVLDVHGLAATPVGNNTWKIVPAVEGRQNPGASPQTLASAPGAAMITQVMQLNNVQVAQLVPALRPLMSSYAQLAAYSPSNMLIISGRAANVRRIMALARQLDKPITAGVALIQLQHASATNVSQVLASMLQQSGHGQLPLKLAADPRTNTILISGSPAEQLKVKALISSLDRPTGRGGDTQVIYLHYAQAEDLAKILQGYVKSQQQAAGGGGKNAAAAAHPQIDVLADKGLNALIVTAPPKPMADIRQIISRLDVRRAQVLVQGIIAELSSNAAAQLGISWAADSSGAAGLTNFPNGVVDIAGLAQVAGGGSATTTGSTAGVLSSSSLPGGLLFGVGHIVKNGMSFVALLNALTSDSKTNILSTPSLVTLDNQEASLVSGQKVPFVTGQYVNTGQTQSTTTNLINPFQTVQREQLGLQIKIKPQINYGGNTVTLKIDAHDSTLAPSVQGAAGLVTNDRQLKTTVVARNRQIIVLGGLIDTQLQQSRQKVPLLGDIPLLGNLFRYRQSNKTRQNLMIFLRPVLLRSAHDSDLVTEPRYNEIRELQIGRGGSVPLLPGVKPPVLPQFEGSSAATGAPEAATLIEAVPRNTSAATPATTPNPNGNGG